MKKELELKLQAEFPSFFRDMYGDPCHTCMHWGIAIGDGWFNLLHELCVAIKHNLRGEDFKFDQIKEKFGLLNIHASGGNKAIYQLMGAAQKESANICEFCGSKEDITTEGSVWIQTLCKTCRTMPR